MNATEGADRFQRNKFASCPFGTPPLPYLPPRDPLSAPPGQVLALRNQTLMDRAGQQGDAVPADLIAEVLAGDAEGTGAGWLQDIPVQVIPLFCVGQRIGSGHRSMANTPVLHATDEVVKGSKSDLIR